PGKNDFHVSEDETTQAVHKMIIKISSQNHVTEDTYHANSNANSETLPNGWKKNKSRLNGSNSSQAPNLNIVSPAAGRTISKKPHAKSSIRPELPRKLLAREDNMQSRVIDASQSQKLGGTFKFKRNEASKFTGRTST
nr:cullin, conserved site-containing protein [Tanacetum cinerariifolium]